MIARNRFVSVGAHRGAVVLAVEVGRGATVSDSKYYALRYETCSRCKGKGFLSGKVECPVCEGRRVALAPVPLHEALHGVGVVADMQPVKRGFGFVDV